MTPIEKPKKPKSAWGKKPFYMAGTEKTGEYVVVVVTPLGRIGYRVLGDDTFRVRLEPSDVTEKLIAKLASWKQPDKEQKRFSTVIGDSEGSQDNNPEKTLKGALLKGMRALIVRNSELMRVNAEAPEWARKLVDEARYTKGD